MKKDSGFTLLEVLIALIIIAGGIMVLANSWSGNFMRIRKGNVQNNVATLLERKMVELEVEYKDKALTEIPESESGDFGSDFPQYTWKMESRELELPDMTAFLISQKDGADETLIAMMKQTTEFINKSVKEVKVTVLVKSKARELKFAASQYFVDYNGDFGAAAGGAGSDSGSDSDSADKPAGGDDAGGGG